MGMDTMPDKPPMEDQAPLAGLDPAELLKPPLAITRRIAFTETFGKDAP